MHEARFRQRASELGFSDPLCPEAINALVAQTYLKPHHSEHKTLALLCARAIETYNEGFRPPTLPTQGLGFNQFRLVKQCTHRLIDAQARLKKEQIQAQRSTSNTEEQAHG